MLLHAGIEDSVLRHTGSDISCGYPDVWLTSYNLLNAILYLLFSKSDGDCCVRIRVSLRDMSASCKAQIYPSICLQVRLNESLKLYGDYTEHMKIVLYACVN